MPYIFYCYSALALLMIWLLFTNFKTGSQTTDLRGANTCAQQWSLALSVGDNDDELTSCSCVYIVHLPTPLSPVLFKFGRNTSISSEPFRTATSFKLWFSDLGFEGIPLPKVKDLRFTNTSILPYATEVSYVKHINTFSQVVQVKRNFVSTIVYYSCTVHYCQTNANMW